MPHWQQICNRQNKQTDSNQMFKYKKKHSVTIHEFSFIIIPLSRSFFSFLLFFSVLFDFHAILDASINCVILIKMQHNHLLQHLSIDLPLATCFDIYIKKKIRINETTIANNDIRAHPSHYFIVSSIGQRENINHTVNAFVFCLILCFLLFAV